MFCHYGLAYDLWKMLQADSVVGNCETETLYKLYMLLY